MTKFKILSLCLILTICVSVSHAAFIVEGHSSGWANATNFTGTGSPSSAVSAAPGIIGIRSIFGGSHDYLFAYTPAVDMDNWSPAAGTDLRNSHKASGLMGGFSGKYNVYITWPVSTNVDPLGCTITITNDAEDVVLNPVNMNTGKTGNPGGNDGWYRIAQNIHLSGGVKYTVRQKANTTTSVSQRNQGVLWELVEADPLPISWTETGDKTSVVEGGGADTYAITLVQQPLTATEVAVIAKDPNQVILNGTLNQTILTFTPDNWSTPQTVSVVANDDLLVEQDHSVWLRHWVASATDPNSQFAGFLKVNIADNEAPGILVVESDETTAVDEQGPTSDTYTIRLMMPPTAPVTITITADAETVISSGGPVGSTLQLTFTATNWFAPQTVTVTAVDDSDREVGLNHNSTLKHTVTSADAGYNNMSVPNIFVAVADNDCGVWGFASSDINEDCQVNLEDFAVVASEWMTCSVPFIEGCVNQLPQ